MVSPRGVLRTNPKTPCSFCHLNENNEILYGPIYTLSDLTCHYFCVLLASNLIQNGKDYYGILGFLYKDIKNEIKQSQQKKCLYCGRGGAAVACCHRTCKHQFHATCGARHGAKSLFYATYQSFCHKHRGNQDIPKNILANHKTLFVRLEKMLPAKKRTKKYIKELINYPKLPKVSNLNFNITKDSVCYICFEPIFFGYRQNNVFWPPCCKTDNWFHRHCLSRMGLSAGTHFIRCPLCNNKSEFVDALYKFGIYIPIRDAAWERENGAYSDLLERPDHCIAENCICPKNRKYDDSESWKFFYCTTCGSEAIHKKCLFAIGGSKFECYRCVKILNSVSKPPCEDSNEDINVIDDEDDGYLSTTSKSITPNLVSKHNEEMSSSFTSTYSHSDYQGGSIITVFFDYLEMNGPLQMNFNVDNNIESSVSDESFRDCELRPQTFVNDTPSLNCDKFECDKQKVGVNHLVVEENHISEGLSDDDFEVKESPQEFKKPSIIYENRNKGITAPITNKKYTIKDYFDSKGWKINSNAAFAHKPCKIGRIEKPTLKIRPRRPNSVRSQLRASKNIKQSIKRYFS